MHTSKKCRVAWVLAAAAMSSVSLMAITPTPAYAECGDPGRSPCTGLVPSTDQVLAVLARMTDPGIPASSKTDVVSPGFAQDEAGTIDNHLQRMDTFGGLLPPNFVVTNIEPAPADMAGVTVETTGGYKHAIHPRPVVLVNQGGHWLINHDSALDVLNGLWNAGQRVPAYGPAI